MIYPVWKHISTRKNPGKNNAPQTLCVKIPKPQLQPGFMLYIPFRVKLAAKSSLQVERWAKLDIGFECGILISITIPISIYGRGGPHPSSLRKNT